MEWISVVAAIRTIVASPLAFIVHRCFRHDGPTPPEIEFYRGGAGVYHFRPDRAEWEIIGIEVTDVVPGYMGKMMLRKAMGRIEEWSHFLDYPQGAHELEAIEIHPGCYKANLAFICATPLQVRIWRKPWQKKEIKRQQRVLFRYDKYKTGGYDYDPIVLDLAGYRQP